MSTPLSSGQASLTKIPEVDDALHGLQELTDKLVCSIARMKQTKSWSTDHRTVADVQIIAQAMDSRLHYFLRKFAEFREEAKIIRELCAMVAVCSLCGANIDWRERNQHLLKTHNIGNVPSQESKDRLVIRSDDRAPKT